MSLRHLYSLGIVLFLSFVVFLSCKEPSKSGVEKVNETEQPEFEIDSVTIATGSAAVIIINNFMWLAENLNIPVAESWCYENKDDNCDVYGRLYRWQTAQESCIALGDGWRLPSDKEWKILVNAFGGYYDYSEAREYGNAKKANERLTIAEDISFFAKLNGWRGSNGGYSDKGNIGFYWTADDINEDQANFYIFYPKGGRLTRRATNKRMGMSCRCIKDL